MKRRPAILPLALADIDAIARYIAQDSPDSALRFLDAFARTIDEIRSFPHLGRARRYRHPLLKHLRTRPVIGFPNHLVFYQVPDDQHVLVIRVLHAAMRIQPFMLRRDSH